VQSILHDLRSAIDCGSEVVERRVATDPRGAGDAKRSPGGFDPGRRGTAADQNSREAGRDVPSAARVCGTFIIASAYPQPMARKLGYSTGRAESSSSVGDRASTPDRRGKLPEVAEDRPVAGDGPEVI